MSWRPEGWENPHGFNTSDAGYQFGDIERHWAYEAGATAMLEALKAGGERVEAGEEWVLRFKESQYTIELKYAEQPGHLVFIPEERGE